MFVDFWGVGASSASSISMNTGDISTHLLADWVPSLPATVGTSFIGWPPFLIESRLINGRNLLTIREEVRGSERQWKGVLSWMLGIAGARHVLALENYRWIAPLSAFYPEAVQTVDLSRWHILFPRSSVTAMRNLQSRSRLRPDYLALRSTAGGKCEWALVESKGTKMSLANTTSCPKAWADQVRNAVIHVNDNVITTPRHLVVATRVNPNAFYPSSRCIQLRAWNRKEESDSAGAGVPPGTGPDIASAQLFGLFRGLGLRENALALALSVQGRTQARYAHIDESTKRETDRVRQQCDIELRERTKRHPQRADGLTSTLVPLEIDRGIIDVEIMESVLSLARKLQETESDDVAAAALQEADTQIDDWHHLLRRRQRGPDEVWLPFGVEIRLPRGFDSR